MAHTPPMLLVDEVKGTGDNFAITAFTVLPENIFLVGGVLAREALAEIMAQSIAALNAYTAWKNNTPAGKGFLVGLKNIVFSGDVYTGDVITCRAEITDFLAKTYIANAEIAGKDGIIAKGEIRIYAWD
jgi:predicted hotdog family 3-hydroxylacyl-ACP dehydratase